MTPIVLVMSWTNKGVLTVNDCLAGHNYLHLYLLSKSNHIINCDLSSVFDFLLDFGTFAQE